MYVLTNAETGEEFTREETKAGINRWVFEESGHADGEYTYSLRWED